MKRRTGFGLGPRPRYLRTHALLPLSLIAAFPVLLAGCSAHDWPVLAPGAPVAMAERNLLLFISGVALLVIVPVFVLTIWVVRKYRAGDAEGPYSPLWTYSKRIDLGIWMIACAAAVVIAVTIWIATFKLDPYKRVGPDLEPVQVQVVAEDWKWLFIYPQQHIAVVNQLVFPTQRPLELHLTADTVMSALYIPGLTSQMYAMAGMQTKLNAVADRPATFIGRNAQFTGKGFPTQSFRARAVSEKDFEAWVHKVRQSPKTLDAATYNQLRRPSSNMPVTYYGGVEPKLFRHIIEDYKHGPTPLPTRTARMRKEGE